MGRKYNPTCSYNGTQADEEVVGQVVKK